MLGSLKKVKNTRLTNKAFIMRAIEDEDVDTLRQISNLFYRISGVYKTACDYLATFYRYDWYLYPEVFSENVPEEKVVKEFKRVSSFFNNSYVKKTCGDIALNVMKNGCYYAYLIAGQNCVILQELPVGYCRCRYKVMNMPAVEFNMRFFDDKFPDINYRMKILKMFPKEFQKGYLLYKQGKLKSDTWEDTTSGWYLLEPGSAIKFSLSDDDLPPFINAIPSIIDLDAAQDLDRRKQLQKLLKIIIQKLPLDKNGDLIFDVDEARDIHNNAVDMLSGAVGVDVLTTFTDVDSIDLSDKNTTTSKDDLEKVERTVYNNMGITKNNFNAEGNIAQANSILEDEGSIRSLWLQFQIFYDMIAQKIAVNRKKYCFRFSMLGTTQYNYKEMSKLYKEQTQNGFSKMLPQVALGHTQSEIIDTAVFENEILHLSEIMIPPLMSSTLNGEDILGAKNQRTQTNSQNKTETQTQTETKSAGRPEKPDTEKSDKTIANRESMN